MTDRNTHFYLTIHFSLITIMEKTIRTTDKLNNRKTKTNMNTPDLRNKLKDYIDTFNADDDELYSQEIPDSSAYDFLSDRIPLLDCPDKNIEKTYYFRWWTLRKHWKNTP